MFVLTRPGRRRGSGAGVGGSGGRRAREKNLRAEIAGNPLMTLDSGKKKEGKGSFWKAFCDLHARSGSVPDARLRDF